MNIFFSLSKFPERFLKKGEKNWGKYGSKNLGFDVVRETK